ncbi:MAG: hypothetical protein HYV27_03515 [Candidatus Hydrogenedentes bacterium]|nr:hypothetical protein [Candidatus Hydrogenedentota bacterium]
MTLAVFEALDTDNNGLLSEQELRSRTGAKTTGCSGVPGQGRTQDYAGEVLLIALLLSLLLTRSGSATTAREPS